MSQGTNKERLEQNNELLEEIKVEIQNLPEGSGDIKLFGTIEEMQADPDAKEGDMALVYGTNTRNWDGEGIITGATFPNKVVLPSAFTEKSARLMMRSDAGMFDCSGSLSPTSGSFSVYTDTSSMRIRYTSTDGITYTRTDGGDEYVDFGCEAYRYDGYEWNDAFGYFMVTGGKYFGGLYQYELHNKTTESFKVPTIAGTLITVGSGRVDSLEYSEFMTINTPIAKFQEIVGNTKDPIYLSTNGDFKVIRTEAYQYDRLAVDSSGAIVGMTNVYAGEVAKIYKINFETEQLEYITTLQPKLAYEAGNYYYVEISDMVTMPIRNQFCII